MKKHFQKETNPDILREILSHCESEIENLASEGRVARTYFHYKNHKKIKILTELRADILDRMFELHFNKTDFERLSKVNSMLETYENNLIAKHIDMYKKLKEMDNNYKLDSYLLYRHLDENYSLQPLEDDSYYGSNWNEMFDIIEKVSKYDNELLECSDEGHTIYNDGWRESIKASFSMTSEIKPCFSFWELITCHGFSIPDVLRMKSYYFVYSPYAVVDA